MTDGFPLEANGTILKAQFDDYLASFNGGVINLAGKLPQFVPEIMRPPGIAAIDLPQRLGGTIIDDDAASFR